MTAYYFKSILWSGSVVLLTQGIVAGQYLGNTTGLSSRAAFQGLGNTGTTTGGTTTGGATSGGTGATAGNTGLTTLGSGLGGFDASFGASGIAGAAAASAFSRSGAALGMSGLGGFGGLGASRGGFGGMGGFGGGRGGFGSMQSGQNNENKVRAIVRVGFPYQGPAPVATAQRVNNRFSRMPLPESLQGVTIEMDGRTAVMTGQVASAEDAKLVERLLSLEPGINDVRNELEVTGAASAAGNNSEVVPAPQPIR